MLAALCLSAVAALAALPSASAARTSRTPALAPANTVIDGPSAAIVSLDGMSIARDGTGGLVYLKDVAGVAHVFVSVLENGGFQPPVQVDAGMLAASSQPVIAAGDDGVLLVGFINNGALYVVQTGASGAPLSAAAQLYPAAENPSISISNFGKAYLAFTATDGPSGGEIRTGYYFQGQWALESSSLNNNPSVTAGTGAGRPQVATAGDGVGIVAWGEGGHVYTRRVVKTSPSVVDEQADVPSLNGWQEVSAGDPVIGSGGDSSYASVGFQELLSAGGSQQSRVLMNRLHGSQFDGIEQGDGVSTGGPEGADEPQTSVTEYGDGWVVSEHDQTHELFATTLGSNDSFGTTERIDSLPNSTAPDGVSSNAGLVSTFIAWQQNPGVDGPAEIRVRYAPDGADLGGELVVSTPDLGATDADLGLVAAGDVSGDAAVAWVQGAGASTQIVAAQLYQAPGGFVPSNSFRYVTTADPVLVWTGAAELWGSPEYVLKIDGAVVGQTTALQLAPPAALTNGRHSYQVAAVNQAGLSTPAPSATVFVDTVHPKASFTISGTRVIGYRQRASVKYSDPPPRGFPKSAASGVKTVAISWGDGTAPAQIRKTTATHVYKRKRTYTIRVFVTDRAGNQTVVSKKITIRATLPHKKGKGKTKARKRRGVRR